MVVPIQQSRICIVSIMVWLTIVVGSPSRGFSQNDEQSVAKTLNSENEIEKKLNQAQAILKESPNKSIAIAQRAIELANTSQAFGQCAQLHLTMGDAYSELELQDSAIHHYQQVVYWANKHTDPSLFEDGLNEVLYIFRSNLQTNEAIRWLDSLKNSVDADFVMGSMLIDLYATTLLYYTGRVSECIDLCKSNIVVAQSINNVDKEVLWSLYLSSFYYEIGGYDQATATILDALTLAQGHPIDPFDLYRLKSNLSLVYTATGQYKQAKDMLMEVADYYCTAQYDAIECANAMANLGDNAVKTRSYDHALSFFDQAIQHAQTVNYNNIVAYGNLNKGMVYLDQGKFELAQQNFNKSLKLAESIDDLKVQAAANIGLGACQVESAPSSSTLMLITKGLSIARDIENLEMQRDSYRWLHKFYARSGDYSKALEAYISYSSIKDSLLSQEKSKEILRLQTQYEVLEKDKQLEIQTLQLTQKEKQVRAVAAIGVLAITLVSLLFFSIHQKRKRASFADRLALANLKGQSLYNQINEHFISNSIARVYYLLKLGKEKEAEEYAQKFSDYLKSNLNNLRKESVSLDNELQLVDRYVGIERIRGKHFEFNVEFSPNVDLKSIIVPPFFIQPIVENSIKHGIATLADGEGKISVNIFAENRLVTIEVVDNGVGSTQEAISQGGVGMKITRERLGLLNRRNTVDLISTELGTTVVLKLYHN